MGGHFGLIFAHTPTGIRVVGLPVGAGSLRAGKQTLKLWDKLKGVCVAGKGGKPSCLTVDKYFRSVHGERWADTTPATREAMLAARVRYLSRGAVGSTVLFDFEKAGRIERTAESAPLIGKPFSAPGGEEGPCIRTVKVLPKKGAIEAHGYVDGRALPKRRRFAPNDGDSGVAFDRTRSG